MLFFDLEQGACANRLNNDAKPTAALRSAKQTEKVSD